MMDENKKKSREVKRVKDLLTNPELLQYFIEDDDSLQIEEASMFKVLNYNVRHLPEQLKGVFWLILQLGEASIDEISRSLDEPEITALEMVNDLINQGCVKTVIRDNVRYYAVNEIWKKEHFPEGPIIPLIYQYNLLSDTPRIDFWEKAIKQSVKDGSVVVDLGAGTGLLSHMAARAGGRVYSVEIDPGIAEVGRKIVEENELKNITYVIGDARYVKLPENADVVMCEMFDTALIAEHQVPVLNAAWETGILKEDSIVIPYSSQTSIQLVNSPYLFKGSIFRLIHYEAYGSKIGQSLSGEHIYHDINFYEINDEKVNEEIHIPVDREGIVNGVRLLTRSALTKGADLTECTAWFNPPVVLPAKDDINVKIGDVIKVHLLYTLGGGWNSLAWSISKVV